MKKYKIVVICMCILLLLAGGVYAQQKTVRILAIGNSFSQDAVEIGRASCRERVFRAV